MSSVGGESYEPKPSLSLLADMRDDGELVKDYTHDDDIDVDDGRNKSHEEKDSIEQDYNSYDELNDDLGGAYTGHTSGGATATTAGGQSSTVAYSSSRGGVSSNTSQKTSSVITGAVIHDEYPMPTHAASPRSTAPPTIPPPLENGTVLEAAFVDPAYTWPPPDGEGRNAIELQASISLINGDTNENDDNYTYVTSDDEGGDDGSETTGSSPRHNHNHKDFQRLQETQKQHSQLQKNLSEKMNNTQDTSQPKMVQAPKNKNQRQPTKKTTTTVVTKKKRFFSFCCCKNKAKEDVVTDSDNGTIDNNNNTISANQVTYEMDVEAMEKERALRADERRQLLQQQEEEKQMQEEQRQNNKRNKKKHKKQLSKAEIRAERRRNRYGRVPEGILIYRLNTTTRKLSLLSHPHSRTDERKLIREIVVTKAQPSPDKSRRGMIITAEDGSKHQLVACEQRTAIAWLETITIMLETDIPASSSMNLLPSSTSEIQASERNEEVQGQYLNLANYSNKLIRSGALPGSKKGSGGAGGIYYSIEVQHEKGGDINEEALESIAKRRAVIKDSWDFYRMICSLLRDKHKYDEVFRKMQLDPVYPYLNSMSGLNDPADGGISDKVIYQKELPQYLNMTQQQIAEDLVMKAERALPSLVEICKALAGSLGMEEVGVGPTKDLQSALRKAERKYQGELLKVTDYCRALLVVKDFATLLALLELARDSFGPLIRRVKMSSLKSEHKAKAGGYRDCIINVELKEHICEIQVHLWPMWGVCGVDGFRHYRHCLEYSTDSFEDPHESLEGLSRKTRAELIVMAEEAVVDTPLDNLEWYHEKVILDYFAEVGLFLKHGLDVWAEITLRHLIKLRIESPDIGPEHHETIILYKYLAQSLRAQGKTQQAEEAYAKVQRAAKNNKNEKDEAAQSLWENFLNAQAEAFEMIMDPNKKEREEEETLRREVKASKKQWRRIRNERFKFLDLNIDSIPAGGGYGDEKKMSH